MGNDGDASLAAFCSICGVLFFIFLLAVFIVSTTSAARPSLPPQPPSPPSPVPRTITPARGDNGASFFGNTSATNSPRTSGSLPPISVPPQDSTSPSPGANALRQCSCDSGWPLPSSAPPASGSGWPLPSSAPPASGSGWPLPSQPPSHPAPLETPPIPGGAENQAPGPIRKERRIPSFSLAAKEIETQNLGQSETHSHLANPQENQPARQQSQQQPQKQSQQQPQKQSQQQSQKQSQQQSQQQPARQQSQQSFQNSYGMNQQSVLPQSMRQAGGISGVYTEPPSQNRQGESRTAPVRKFWEITKEEESSEEFDFEGSDLSPLGQDRGAETINYHLPQMEHIKNMREIQHRGVSMNRMMPRNDFQVMSEANASDSLDETPPNRIDFRSHSTEENFGRDVRSLLPTVFLPQTRVAEDSTSTDTLEGVLDLCSYGGETIKVLPGGKIEVGNGGNMREVVSNISPELLAVHGYLYALAGGRLYSLASPTSERVRWRWEVCSWAPKNLVNVSCTLNGENMSLQSSEGVVYIYDKQNTLVAEEKIAPGRRRFYGSDRNNYVEVGNGKAAFFPSGDLVDEVDAAALGFHGERYMARKKRMIRLIDWKPVILS